MHKISDVIKILFMFLIEILKLLKIFAFTLFYANRRNLSNFPLKRNILLNGILKIAPLQNYTKKNINVIKTHFENCIWEFNVMAFIWFFAIAFNAYFKLILCVHVTSIPQKKRIHNNKKLVYRERKKCHKKNCTVYLHLTRSSSWLETVSPSAFMALHE